MLPAVRRTAIAGALAATLLAPAAAHAQGVPGTDEDEAVFHADGEELVLGRSGGDWVTR